MTPLCRVNGCERLGTKSRGLCQTHYSRWLKTGTTESLERTFMPLQPLIDACGGGTVASIARQCHLERQTVQGWIDRGRITLIAADRAAIALGVHPWIIWGDTWWDGADLGVEV